MQNKENFCPLRNKNLKSKYLQNSLRIKTDHHEMTLLQDFADLNFVSPSQQLKPIKPLLQNRKINFHTKNKNKKVVDVKLQNNINKTKKMTNNIEQLKKQIMQLEKDDFYSYRRKMEEMHPQQNKQINKYNQHNSIIMDIKSKQYYTQGSKAKRPKTTLGLFGIFSTTPISSSSAPRKYYSKAKKRKLNNTCSTNSVKEAFTVNIEDCQKNKKNQQIVLGMKNMLRGYKKRAKTTNLSSHC